MNQNKHQNHDQDRKSQQGSDDNRNRDKHASQGHQGSTQHMNSGAPGSKNAGHQSHQNRNPQR